MLCSVSILVAGFGNVLRGDDGFGVAVAQALHAEPIPDGVRVIEVGIGGIHLVQELLTPVDALVVIDAVDLGKPAGTVLVIRPDIRDVTILTGSHRRDELADMHYATPERALMLAGGLGLLPTEIFLVGCQVADAQRLADELSPVMAGSVQAAVAEVRSLVSELGVAWA